MYIYAFTYKPTPTAMFTIGSLWASSLQEAKEQAKEALKQAYPNHVTGKLFRASNTKANRNMLAVKNPDTGDYLTPAQALELEQAKWAAIQK